MAAACAVVAAVMAVRLDYDKAFVMATIGAVCWFLNYRTQLKALIPSRDEEELEPLVNESDET